MLTGEAPTPLPLPLPLLLPPPPGCSAEEPPPLEAPSIGGGSCIPGAVSVPACVFGVKF